ncbi:MAG TPA: hypothetical protein ENK57_08325 [Polyangiaceae bacterium]|nr:hypothetical protein [Polyangiaceae bacterium]
MSRYTEVVREAASPEAQHAELLRALREDLAWCVAEIRRARSEAGSVEVDPYATQPPDDTERKRLEELGRAEALKDVAAWIGNVLAKPEVEAAEERPD